MPISNTIVNETELRKAKIKKIVKVLVIVGAAGLVIAGAASAISNAVDADDEEPKKTEPEDLSEADREFINGWSQLFETLTAGSNTEN